MTLTRNRSLLPLTLLLLSFPTSAIMRDFTGSGCHTWGSSPSSFPKTSNFLGSGWPYITLQRWVNSSASKRMQPLPPSRVEDFIAFSVRTTSLFGLLLCLRRWDQQAILHQGPEVTYSKSLFTEHLFFLAPRIDSDHATFPHFQNVWRKRIALV